MNLKMLKLWILQYILIINIYQMGGHRFIFTYFNRTTTNTGVTIDLQYTNTRPQLINVTYDSNITMGENLLFTGLLYRLSSNNPQLLLKLSMKEGPCYFANHYLGQYVYDLKSLAGINPNACPLPKGKYRAINYVSNSNNMRLPMLPMGNLLLHIIFKEKKTDKVVSGINLGFIIE